MLILKVQTCYLESHTFSQMMTENNFSLIALSNTVSALRKKLQPFEEYINIGFKMDWMFRFYIGFNSVKKQKAFKPLQKQNILYIGRKYREKNKTIDPTSVLSTIFYVLLSGNTNTNKHGKVKKSSN